jgi:hypothetical protein
VAIAKIGLIYVWLAEEKRKSIKAGGEMIKIV